MGGARGVQEIGGSGDVKRVPTEQRPGRTTEKKTWMMTNDRSGSIRSGASSGLASGLPVLLEATKEEASSNAEATMSTRVQTPSRHRQQPRGEALGGLRRMPLGMLWCRWSITCTLKGLVGGISDPRFALMGLEYPMV